MNENENVKNGFNIVDLALLAGIAVIVAAVSLPNLVQSRKRGNEATAIGALKTIATSEAIFREGDKENDGDLDYGMLSELDATKVIDHVLGSGTKQGYFFEAAYSVTTSEFLWFATANPAEFGITGDRLMETNQAGVLFFTTSLPALTLDTASCQLPHADRSTFPV